MRKTFTLLIAFLALCVSSWATPTTVTWNAGNGLTSIGLNEYTNLYWDESYHSYNDGAKTAMIEGVKVTISATVDGSDASFSTNENSTDLSVSNGATLTFSSALYLIHSIVINFEGNSGYATGWTDGEGTLTWTGSATHSVTLTAASVSHITSIVFTVEAIPTTTVTWNTEEVATILLECSDIDEVQTASEIEGITASLTKISSGDNCQFSSSEIWFSNACGKVTFTSSVGNIISIVITCGTVWNRYDLSGGWTFNGEANTLTWEGTASNEVILSGGIDFMVSSIVFIIDASAPASVDPVNQGPVTWDFVNDAELASIYLSRYTNYDFNGYYSEGQTVNYIDTVKVFKGIVATISAFTDGSYACFSNQNNYSIDLENGGTLTFSTELGLFQSIVVNTTTSYGSNSGDWKWNGTEHTLTWAGTPANSVVMDNVDIDHITSIVFTFVAAASADPEPVAPTPSGPSFTWAQRQVNHVYLNCSSNGETQTTPVIKNIITSLTRTENEANCYFGYWGDGVLNLLGNGGELTFQSIAGDITGIVINCSSVTSATDLSADWTYNSEAGTLTWLGTAAETVTLSGDIVVTISSIDFFYDPAPAPRVGEIIGDYYKITGAHTAKVVDFVTEIPASVEDGGVTYYITEIGDDVYSDYKENGYLYIEGENIAKIGAHAFDGCFRTQEITIYSTVVDTIGEAAFKDCKLLAVLELHTNMPPVLGSNAFSGDNYLNHINVYDYDWDGINVVNDYKAATGWSAYAAKIGELFAEASAGEQFFYHNQMTDGLYSVIQGSNYYDIKGKAKVIPYAAEVNALYPITRTGTLVIPEEAFYMGSGYEITGIGPNAYKDSTRFDMVLMPQAVKSIEAGAFLNCTGVEKVYFLWDDPTTVTWYDADKGLDFKTAASGETKIFVPEGRLAEYQAWAPAWASCMVGADVLDVTATPDPDPIHSVRYYRTFFDSNADYMMPASVWAHAGYVSGGEFILHPVAFDGQILPRGTAVVLESETPTYRLIPTGNDAPLYTGPNDLVGTDVDIPRTSVGNNGENVYVLGKEATINDQHQVGMGMYRYTGTTLGAHKAYLIYNGSDSGSSGQQNAPARFVFRHQDQATDIENIQSADAPCTKILRDGQLVIIKDGKEYNAQGLIIK